MQHTSHLLMIQPVNFGFNTETAVNNTFQKNMGGDVQQQALQEFTDFVAVLRKNKIDVTVVKDSLHPATPDSIFPNNWISFHADGRIFLYPMFAVNRRLERKTAVQEAVKSNFSFTEIIDLTGSENDGLFLEGTGSMVLDRENKIAYACLSPRTDEKLLNEFCKLIDYNPITFKAIDNTGVDIYHTNVMMCIAKTFAVVCLESVTVHEDKAKLIGSLIKTNKEIVDISLQQLNHYAGNMLQVINEEGELMLIMSTQAYQSLTNAQIEILQKHNRIIHSSLNTIETVGGGSARCMMAEVFLLKK
ncbi:MAG: amidinotransferase [Chitinophagaceae bacterium]|nr:amidinotransferase [Chitinophagaceae bacterium]MBL0201440.1 amidinotransferase [Chitinophagaceae bacterium]